LGKDPIVGMNRVAVYDFASLYNNTVTIFLLHQKRGVEDTKNKGFCTNEEIDISKHVLCVNGVVFEKNITNIENVGRCLCR
jgi:nitrogen regulatory protein PII-like uncharacterized protein